MHRIFLWSLIAIVAIAPLPLGSNRPLAWSLLSLAVGVLLICWSVDRAWTGQRLSFAGAHLKLPLTFFSLACLWVGVQLVPNMPFGLTHPGWLELNTFMGTDTPGRITVDPDWTVTTLMRWLTYAGVFWLATQLCRKREAASVALRVFTYVGGGYALYGLIAHLSGSDSILIYEKWVGHGALSSTFVNRNSYAAFAGLGVITAMASLIATRTLNSAPPTGVGQRILFLVSGFSVKTAYYCLAFFLTLSALVLTGSRGGVLATLMGLFVLAWHMRVRSKKRKNTVLLPMVGVLAIMLVVFSFSGGYLNDRLDRGADLNRLNVYQVTVEAIQDHAWIGSGLGSFRQIFPLYRDEDNLSSSVWHRAHNTYLENTLELGIPASLLLHLAMAYLVWMCWRGVNTRSRDMHFSAVGLAASVLVALHSLVDFSLQIPAITIAYMFLMGIAVSQSISTRRV